MGKRTRTQATIFFIVGLVLVITVVAMIMLTRAASKKVTKQETENVHEIQLDVQPIKNFAAQCLTVITEDAVTLIGKQGGYLYASQGGSLLDYLDSEEGTYFVGYDGSKVAYNILPPRISFGEIHALPPKYPWINFPYSDASRSSTVFERQGAFGTNNVPVINISFGPNSLQEQLIRYIDQNIDRCLNDEVFRKQGFSVVRGNKSVSLDINENDIVVRLFYHLQITNLATDDKTAIELFNAKIPIRLGSIQFFVSDLVQKDISNIKFNIVNSTSKNGFVVSMERDALNSDDMIIVTDMQTRIRDREFQYIFARKNRNPAMFLLSSPIQLPRFIPGTTDFSMITQEVILENQTAPMMLDPDEDTMDGFRIDPLPPIPNIYPETRFTVQVSDGQLTDEQQVSVVRVDT